MQFFLPFSVIQIDEKLFLTVKRPVEGNKILHNSCSLLIAFKLPGMLVAILRLVGPDGVLPIAACPDLVLPRAYVENEHLSGVRNLLDAFGHLRCDPRVELFVPFL